MTRRYDSHNFWERRYHQKKALLVFTVLNSVVHQNDMILDAGCGSGELCRSAENLGGRVIGLDISKSYLRRASVFVGNRICASLDHLPFRPSAFDVVLCADVIEHIPAYDKVLAELYRVSRRVVVITTPCKGIIRELYSRLFPEELAYIDKEVGHIHILPLFELRQKLLNFNWTVSCRSYHVIQPIADKFISKKLVRIVDLFEKIANVFLPEQGTISLVILTHNSILT